MADSDYTYHGDDWLMCKIVESVCTPETDIMYATMLQLKKNEAWKK